MQIEMLKSKIHGAVVTERRPDYEGSLTIDIALMEAVGLRTHEKILVANFRNGARFETYAIAGPRGSRAICVNGAATVLTEVGDRIIVMSFCVLTTAEADSHKPRVVRLDESNCIQVPQANRDRS